MTKSLYQYQTDSVDGDEEQVIQGIRQIKKDLETKKDDLLRIGDLNACNFSTHLCQPLFHVRRGGNITILPVALGESEYQFVTDLKTWCGKHKGALEEDGLELFLLRDISRGKDAGFFEAGNFSGLYPLDAGRRKTIHHPLLDQISATEMGQHPR